MPDYQADALAQEIIAGLSKQVSPHSGKPLFDAVISRAFAALGDFMAACRHLLAPGGVLAAMTGVAPATLDTGCKLIPLRVPLLDAQRHLVLCPASSP